LIITYLFRRSIYSYSQLNNNQELNL